MKKFNDVIIDLLTENMSDERDEHTESCEWCGKVLSYEDEGIGSYDIGERHEKQNKFVYVCNNKLCPTKIGTCPDCGIKSIKETKEGTFKCDNDNCDRNN